MNKVISRARVTEIDALSDALVRLYKAEKPLAEDAFLKSVMADVERLSAAITTAIKKDKVLSSLEDADTARDEAVRNLGRALSGYAAIPVAAKKEAAEKLGAIFAKYGNAVTTASYASESSLIESLLEDFSAADAKEAASALDGVAELLAAIRTAQDAFNKASDEWTAAKSAGGESATSLKKPLVAAINDRLVPYLTAMSMADAARYGSFCTKVGAEIENVNAALTKRGKKREA